MGSELMPLARKAYKAIVRVLIPDEQLHVFSLKVVPGALWGSVDEEWVSFSDISLMSHLLATIVI